jgi:hypothetical protein
MFTNSNKGFEFYNSQLPTVKKENRKQIMNLLFLEEATNIKARSIALASALKIELADGIRAE